MSKKRIRVSAHSLIMREAAACSRMKPKWEFFAAEQVAEDFIRAKGMLWARSKARKATTCWRTGEPIKPGDTVYHPISNGKDRMRRILPLNQGTRE